MKMIAITVTLAVVLGVAVMLAPVLSFMYAYPAAIPMDGTDSQESKGDNGSASLPANNASYGVNNGSLIIAGKEMGNETTGQADKANLYRSPLSIAEAAQVYGTTDADSKPFSSSLLQVVPVIGGGFITGFAALLYLKKKISQA